MDGLPNYYKDVCQTLDFVLHNEPDLDIIKDAGCNYFYRKLLSHVVELARVMDLFPRIDFNNAFLNACNSYLDPLVTTVTGVKIKVSKLNEG